jgi:hypothetical protein
MRSSRVQQTLVILGPILLVSCSSSYRYEHEDNMSPEPSNADAGADASTDEGGTSSVKTCDDVGKGPGTESCCNGAYCNGFCSIWGPGVIKCECGDGLECPSNTICCHLLGCSSVETCQKFMDLQDGG